MKENTIFLIIAGGLAVAGGVIGAVAKQWAIALVGAAAVILALVLLF